MNPNTGEIRRPGDFENDPEFLVLPPDLQQMVRMRMHRTEALSSTSEPTTVRGIVANLRNPQSPLAQWAREQRDALREKQAKRTKQRAKMAAASRRKNRGKR